MLKIKILNIYTCFKPYTYQIEIIPTAWYQSIITEVAIDDLPKGLKVGDELELVKKESK